VCEFYPKPHLCRFLCLQIEIVISTEIKIGECEEVRTLAVVLTSHLLIIIIISIL